MNTSISKRPKQVFNLERFFLSQFLVLKWILTTIPSASRPWQKNKKKNI
jgi:hypothetical protein